VALRRAHRYYLARAFLIEYLMEKLLKVEDIPIKISINQLVYNGSWSRMINDHKVELRHLERDYIYLFVDDMQQPMRWKIYERPMGGKLRRGGFIPDGKQWVYYVVGDNGQRYRFLYIVGTRIGTRDGLEARYIRNCQSKKQRAIARQYRLLRMSKRKRERQIALSGQP
jgi:hypothetical protein